MPFRNEVIGRPGFLHGGAIAGLLEFAVIGTLKEALGDDSVEIKPINVTCTICAAASSMTRSRRQR